MDHVITQNSNFCHCHYDYYPTPTTWHKKGLKGQHRKNECTRCKRIVHPETRKKEGRVKPNRYKAFLKKYVITRKEKDWTKIYNDNVTFNTLNNSKYIFSHTHRTILINLAKDLLIRYKLQAAKVNTPTNKIHNTYTLCLYDNTPRYEDQMFNEALETEGLKFHGWRELKKYGGMNQNERTNK